MQDVCHKTIYLQPKYWDHIKHMWSPRKGINTVHRNDSYHSKYILLLSWVKTMDLSDFDKGQIVLARRLGKSVLETAKIVGCSRAAVTSIYKT